METWVFERHTSLSFGSSANWWITVLQRYDAKVWSTRLMRSIPELEQSHAFIENEMSKREMKSSKCTLIDFCCFLEV